MPNQRISELPESGPLYFNDVSFNSIYTESSGAGESSDWFLMAARPKISNERENGQRYRGENDTTSELS